MRPITIGKKKFTTPGSDGKPDSHPDWASFYVDPSNADWQATLRQEARRLRDELRMDGLFIDTALIPRDVFTARREARMRKGMTKVLKSMKSWSRGGFILVNNGDEATVGIEDRVDGLMIETQISAGRGRWDELRLLVARLKPRRRPGFLVTALVYLEPGITVETACAALARFSLPGALYRDDEAGRDLTSLPLATCP